MPFSSFPSVFLVRSASKTGVLFSLYHKCPKITIGNEERVWQLEIEYGDWLSVLPCGFYGSFASRFEFGIGNFSDKFSFSALGSFMSDDLIRVEARSIGKAMGRSSSARGGCGFRVRRRFLGCRSSRFRGVSRVGRSFKASFRRCRRFWG